MPRERLYLFDTTLRDGQQTPGIDFSLDDKLVVMDMLDQIGIDYVEGGYPGANPTDTALFAETRPLKATFTAFGMVKRAGRSAANDPGLQDLLRAKAKAICFVGKSWDYHVRVALQVTNEENLASIRESIENARAAGPRSPARLRAFLRWLQGQPRLCARSGQGGLRRRRALGRACATPMAARCRMKSPKSSVP